MAAPRTIIFRPMPVTSFSTWDVAGVRAALDEHESGVFGSSASLLDAFGRDARIASCLNTRLLALVGKSGVPFHVDRSETGDNRRAKAIATQVEDICWTVHPESSLRRILRDAIGLGVAVARIAWTYNGRHWVPELMPLPAHFLRYSDHEGKWLYDTADGPVEVTPGDGSWFLFTPGGGDEPWMTGAVRALGLPYIMKQFTERDWVRYCEKHGLPIMAIEEPAGIERDAKRNFYEGVRRIGQEGLIREPTDDAGNGFKVRFVEPTDSSWDAFKELLMRIDVACAVFLLGQNLSTEVQGGSYAAAKAHERVRNDYLSGDAEPLSTALRDQLWKPWGRYNVAGWNDELAPWPTWDTDVPEDIKARADTLTTAADVLHKLIADRIPVDIELFCEEVGIPLRQGARVPEPEAPDPNKAPPEPPQLPADAPPPAPELPPGQAP